MADELIRIKPHHFVDILTEVGTGVRRWEPHPYGHAVHTVAAAVVANPDRMLQMDFGADDICAPCRHNIDGLCDDTIDTSYRPAAPKSKRENNLLLDARWGARLGLAEGDRLTARAFAERLRDRAGDVTAIYRELPADRVARRQADLAKGVELFLGGAME